MAETNEAKSAGKKNASPDEPILTLRQWLLILATLIAAAIVANFLK